MIRPRSLPKWFGERASCVPLVYLNYVMTRTRSVRRVVVRYVLLILFVMNAKAGQLIFANLYLKHRHSLYTKRVSKRNRKESKGKSPRADSTPQVADTPPPP